MLSSEHELWRYLKDGLESVAVTLQRIESGATSKGVFDVSALFNGTEIWIELKHRRSQLRPEQKAWCVRRLEAGGRLWVLSGGNGDMLELWKGRDAVILKFYPTKPNYIFPRPVRWHTLRDTLFEE